MSWPGPKRTAPEPGTRLPRFQTRILKALALFRERSPITLFPAGFNLSPALIPVTWRGGRFAAR